LIKQHAQAKKHALLACAWAMAAIPAMTMAVGLAVVRQGVLLSRQRLRWEFWAVYVFSSG